MGGIASQTRVKVKVRVRVGFTVGRVVLLMVVVVLVVPVFLEMVQLVFPHRVERFQMVVWSGRDGDDCVIGVDVRMIGPLLHLPPSLSPSAAVAPRAAERFTSGSTLTICAVRFSGLVLHCCIQNELLDAIALFTLPFSLLKCPL